jgi:hypothetical protein
MEVGIMNGTTLLLWITILIIAIIAIISVKLYYRRDELAKEEGSILPSTESLTNMVSSGKNLISNTNKSESKGPAKLNKSSSNKSYINSISFEEPVVEVEKENFTKYEYESPNQVLVNYDNTVQKFQEPIKENQMDIMTQNNDSKNEKHELKDLFTIDELIKESKRKDSEREKESQSIKKDDDGSLDEIKESIKQRQENRQEEPLIEEVIPESEKEEPLIEEAIEESEKEETINDIISSAQEETEKPKFDMEMESPLIASQKYVDETIETASQESEEEIESISETEGITDVLLDNAEEEVSEDEIKEPTLKTPASKKDYTFGADLDDENVFDDENDLDYRKDIAKITNTIKGSKIFQDVKERLAPEEPAVEDEIEESFIRNVNEYEDEFAPIINETHADYEATYEEYHDPFFDEQLREENTRKVFSQEKVAAPEPQNQGIGTIKDKPARDNIKIQLGNNEVVLKKGDEIIFNHDGETYSSQVYAINGDDISVKYRRQNITIKPSDVKKVY